MTWSRTHTLIAGLALIALTNAVALLGVAWNRSGEPDSELRLTQRELAPPYWRGTDSESGGIELRLKWRSLNKSINEFSAGMDSEWLDRAKLAELGFDMSRPENTAAGQRHYERLSSKQVFVALEFDGPTYQEALQRAQRLADKAPPKNAPAVGINAAAERLKREQTIASRLFAVDASLDPAALRIRYPDRTRYAIVRAVVRVSYYGGNAAQSAQLTGRTDVLNDRINLPPEFRPAFESLPRTYYYNWQEDPKSHFDVTLAFGKRFEPWIVDASAGKD